MALYNKIYNVFANVRATVFQLQLERHTNLPTSIPDLEELCQGENGRVDFAGKLYEKDGQVCWSFGKHKGELVSETRDYANWVLGSDFPSDTKKHIRRILEAVEA
ncbi:MAG: hypothetical protein KDD27_25905 [Saprospiraceae bacterium]|nr:hypothetical protein [Saprospiraceae bacterium]